MRVLVTGANGFVAPWLAQELRAHGHVAIATGLSAGPMPAAENGRIIAVDLADGEALARLLDETRPDALVHLAAISHVPESWQRPAETLEVNAAVTARLYQAAAARGVARFLFASTSDVYGIVCAEDLPLRETSPTRPASPYAVSKLAAEQLLACLGRMHPTAVVVARSFTHTGPGQTTRFACPAFAEQVARVAEGRAEAIHHGDLSARRDILDVRDVVAAYRLLLEAPGAAGGTFNVCRGESIAMADVLAELMRLAGVESSRARLDPSRLRPSDLPELRGSHEALRAATGWEPRIPLAQTLAELLAHHRHGHPVTS